MWAFLIIVVVLIVFKFLYDKNKQSVQIGRQGGMSTKYKTIVAHLMSGHSSAKIFQETSDSMTFGVSSAGGTTIFRLIQTFSKVSITWEMNSPLFGKHKLEWEFPEFMDQDKMHEKIGNDLAQYQENAIKTSPFRDKY